MLQLFEARKVVEVSTWNTSSTCTGRRWQQRRISALKHLSKQEVTS